MGEQIKKRIATGVIALATAAMLLGTGMSSTVAQAAKLEQTYINAPTLRAYITEGEADWKNGVAADLNFDDTALTFNQDLHVYDAEKDGGTHYIYAVEISKYVTKKQRKSIETSLKKAVDQLGKTDQLTIYTFGDKFSASAPVKLSVGASKTDKTKAKSSIQKLLKKKEKTSHLWNAMTNVIETINKSDGSGPNRRVAIFVTGGNFKKSTSTNDKNDVKKQIASATKNAAFYMVQLKTKSKIDGSEASVFTESGGEKFSEKAHGGIAKCFSNVWDTVNKTYVATFQASDSTAFDEAGTVTLSINNKLITENKATNAAYAWQENTTKPMLISATEGGAEVVTKADEQTITFAFSEPVKGAEAIKNYTLTRGDGIAVAIKTLKYDVKTYTCTLTLESEIFADQYELKLANITDIDHNPLAVEPAQISFVMDGQDEDVYNFLQFLKSYWWIILIALVVIILIIVYLVIRSHGGIVEQEDGRKGFANATTVTVGISTPKTKKIVLMMTDSYGKSKEIICNIDSSIFVGRDKMCQIHTDDDKMSRQHFAIESTQLGFFIMDLDTLNGTSVNGTRLTDRQMLKEGDVISAGREKFVFNLYRGE